MKPVVLLCLALVAPLVQAEEYVDYGPKVDVVNKASIAQLGISLNALRVLLAAKEDVYRSLAQLKDSGEYAYIEELENAGYVKIVQRDGLPNGYDRGNAYVAVVPKTAGRELQGKVMGLGAGAAH